MLSISQLARRFGLSRSTLLYYDSIGLLSPRARSAAGYRQYSPQDVARLEQMHPRLVAPGASSAARQRSVKPSAFLRSRSKVYVVRAPRARPT